MSLARSKEYHSVFIHLEAAPLGPPVFEALLFLSGARVVYDIDDAIFMSPKSESKNPLKRILKWRSKVEFTTRRAHKVLAVNPYLVRWATRLNPRVYLIPTTIDPQIHRPRSLEAERSSVPVIGWTGTFSTAPFLDAIRPALDRLSQSHDFKFRVICDVDPGFEALGERYQYVPWSKKTEIEDLQALDIGVMPVPDDPWTRGKVGFKAIQYSALGIVPVASDLGSAREVIEPDVTGVVVQNSTEAWHRALAALIEHPERRARLGTEARDRILQTYSVPAQTPNYRALFS